MLLYRNGHRRIWLKCWAERFWVVLWECNLREYFWSQHSTTFPDIFLNPVNTRFAQELTKHDLNPAHISDHLKRNNFRVIDQETHILENCSFYNDAFFFISRGLTKCKKSNKNLWILFGSVHEWSRVLRDAQQHWQKITTLFFLLWSSVDGVVNQRRVVFALFTLWLKSDSVS